MPAMTVRGVGYGAGSRNLEPGPNLLRVFIGEPDGCAPSEFRRDNVIVAEAAVDDMNPEIFGYLMERLFAEGALDVAWVPIQMKKNRPGTLLQVLCRKEHLAAVARCILAESTTLGVRYHEVERFVAEREAVQLATAAFGTVAVKRIRYPRRRRAARARVRGLQAHRPGKGARAEGRLRGDRPGRRGGQPRPGRLNGGCASLDKARVGR